MKDEKRIAGSSCSNFVNAQHAHFHSQVHAIIHAFGREKVNIPEELETEYKTNIDAEIDLNKEGRAYIETPQLAAIDKERDGYIIYFTGAVRNATLSPIAEVKNAAQALWLTVKNYVGIQNAPRDRQTAQTQGLVLDMKKPENKAYLQTIGHTETMRLIEEKNNEYQALKSSLTNQRAAENLEASKVVRPRTDANYQQITDLIFASYLLETDPRKKAEIGGLIDHLNRLIAEQKTAHKQSHPQPAKKQEPEKTKPESLKPENPEPEKP